MVAKKKTDPKTDPIKNKIDEQKGEEKTEGTGDPSEKPKRTRITSDYFVNIWCPEGHCEHCFKEPGIEVDGGVVYKFNTRNELTRALNQMSAKPAEDDENGLGLLVLDCGCTALVVQGFTRTIATRTVSALV